MMLLTSADEETKAQAKTVAKFKSFATKFKVHVIIIAHPKKEPAGTAFNNDSVSGSSAITNLADNVLSIEKPNIRINRCPFMQ